MCLIEELWFDSWKGKESFLVSKILRLVLGTTHELWGLFFPVAN
jgi:hypothetical protein